MMKLELKPDFEDCDNRALYNAKHAGCSKDGHLAWVYSGSLLEVYLSKSHDIVATWRFGKVLHDRHTKITCVTDFKNHGDHMLLVATSNMSEQGTLCLFSLAKKKVIRVVEFPQRITSVEVLFSNAREDVPLWVMSCHLHFFCGLVAVGTKGGYVYLTDLCLDELMMNHTTEAEPKKLSITSGNLVDPKAKRDRARSHDKHLALLLDDQCHRTGEFYYRRQDDSIQKVFDEGDVHVTSLKYLSQAGILAVGYNFGSFQMWRLHGPTLDYSSRYKPESSAVSRFVLHEPENDPRKLLYLWIANDNSILEEDEDDDRIYSTATISLHQLCFFKKDFYANFGLFYEDLESVYFWMEHSLSLDPYSSETRGIWSSQLINAYTICNPLYTPSAHQANDSFDEGLHSHDQSLSVFVWRVDSKQGTGTSHYWMAIFDLNRWYHAQMPHGIRCSGNAPQVCSFWAVYKLDDVACCSNPPAILDVQVSGENVVKFMSSSSLPPLEHSYPSALELNDVKFVTSQSIIRGQCHGWQGQLLNNLAQDGANYLIQPADFFHQCLRARLVPQHFDTETALSADRKRHALLNLSLDYFLVPALIHQCVELWADGEYVQMGCSLKFLLDWTWSSVIKIKEKLDAACESLFDWSGEQVSSHMRWNLQHQYHSLSNLNQVFTIFLSLTSPLTETGELELELRQETIKLLLQHYEVLLWCVSETLLPEIEESSTRRYGLFEYPVGELCEVYRKRRQEMARLQGVLDDYPLLLIDGLVSCEGNQISSLWESKGGNGLYPPPSMQAVVYMFLLEDISVEVKQAILLYLLQDLVALCDDHGESLVASFLQRFMIAPSLVHKVQGIWFLDHRDFEEGLRQLVRPNTCHQVWSSWMDVAVVNALLAQGEARTATCFVHSGHRLGETLEEQMLMISVLVRNGNVSQAMEFRRRYLSGNANPGNLMCHLLKECHEKKLIGQLLQLHLKPQEEIHIEKYMRERTEPDSLEPLFLYYLHSARFVQAFQLNEEMNRMDRMEASPAAHERSADRNRLMNAYLKVLPDITRKLIMEKQNKALNVPVKRINVNQPTPLSTVVHKSNMKAMSRASFVLAVMDKVEEAMEVVEDQLEEAHEELAQTDREVQSDDRFLKTPLTPRRKSLTRSPATTAQPSEVSLTRLPSNPLSAAKQRTFAGEEAEATEGYKSLHALTMECLSVLKTPSKERVYQSPKLPGLASGQKKTPQSILKVRRISRASLSRDNASSSQWKLASPHSRPKRLGFSHSESSVLSTPSPTLSSKPMEKTPSAGTPKQLRFVGLSPSPSPSPAQASKKLSQSTSEDGSDQVWTDSMDISVDEDDVKDKVEDVVNVESKKEGLTDHEDMDVSSAASVIQKNVITQSSSPAEMQGLVIETESPDRYVEKIGDLVRPDLLSPWKHDLSGEDAADKAMDEDDEEVTFNLSRQIKGESVASQQKEENISTSTKREQSTYNQERIFTTETSNSLLSQKVDSSSPFATSKSSLHKISASETSPGKGYTMSFTQKVEYKSRSVSQTLSIDTSRGTSATQIALTPEKRKRDSRSPPATPPSSKMAKLAEVNRYLKKQHSDEENKGVVDKPLTSLIDKKESQETEEDLVESMKAVAGDDKSGQKSSVKKSPSPEQSRIGSETITSVKEREQATTTTSGHAQAKPDESVNEKFISAEEFLQQTVEEVETLEEPASPSRRKSQRLNRTESSNESSSIVGERQSTRRIIASRQNLAVFNELHSLVEPTESSQRRRGRSKTPERVESRQSETNDDSGKLSDTSLRRSQRRSKTPERIVPKSLFLGDSEKASLDLQVVSESKTDSQQRTLTSNNEVKTEADQGMQRSQRRQSKTPERRVKKRKDEQNDEDKSFTHQLRSERLSETPERALISQKDGESIHPGKSEKTVEISAVESDSQKTSFDLHIVSESKTDSQQGVLISKDEAKTETDQGIRRSQRRQSKTPERRVKQRKDEQNDEDKSFTHQLRSERLSKTPERALISQKDGETIHPGKSEKTVEISAVESDSQKTSFDLHIVSESTTDSQQGDKTGSDEAKTETDQGIRRSQRRQSKTPERRVKKRKDEQNDEDKSFTHQLRSERFPKTPERALISQKDVETTFPGKSEKTVEISSEENEEGSGVESQKNMKPPQTSSDADISIQGSIDPEEGMTVRRSSRLSKTPERIVKRVGKEEKFASQEEVIQTTRHSTRQAKTPERFVKDFVHEKSVSKTSQSKAGVYQVKRSSRQSPVTEHHELKPEAAEKSSSEMEATSEKIHYSLRRSDRKSRTPERLLKTMGSPTTPPKHSRKVLTPTRKSTRPLKSPERLNTDEIEPVEKNVSPSRSSVSNPKSSVKKSSQDLLADFSDEGEKEVKGKMPSEGTKAVVQGGRSVRGTVENEPVIEREEDMPPLRLEIEEEEMEDEPPAAFVFSDPVGFHTRSHDSTQQEGTGQIGTLDDKSVFLFSNPASASASEEVQGSSLSETEGSATADSGAMSEQSSADTRTALPRRKKKLYHYSPKLLSPLKEAERKVRTRTRKQSQQTQAGLRRQSRGSGPLTRRVRPSSKS